MERGGVNTIGKQHFTYLYSPAREIALTKRNILTAWRGSVLFPFTPNRVLTKTGRLGIAPCFSKQGDVCCIAFGLANPLILRPSNSNPEHYNLVGVAYVNRVMDGELLEEFHSSNLKTETITLA